ncbi:MAG: hypothetical protein LW688_13300 [Cryomorphaceae bacterium]|nr:hypothetical protein [Cryomorphaceae bacterium]
MKIYILTLAFSISFGALSQTCGDIYMSEILPVVPSDTSETFLRVGIYCNENAYLDSYQVTTVSNNVVVDAYYCFGWLQVITETDDTVSLGILNSGDYSFVLNTYTSYSPDTGCQAFTLHDSANGSFTVSQTSSTATIHALNPETKKIIKIFDGLGRAVELNSAGLKFIVFNDGTIERMN